MRSGWFRILVSTCAVAVLGLTIGAAASPATTINFLPVGDSNTGQQGNFTPLVNLLDTAGYTANLISNQGWSGYVISNPYTINGVYHYDPARDQDSYHDALQNRITECLNFPNVNSSDTYILLMIGSNDAYDGFDLLDYDVQYRMGTLITSIEDIAPLAHLIVAETVPDCNTLTRAP